MSIISTQNYIVSKIQTISGINSNSVFPYEEPTWSIWPAISVTLKESTGKFITNQQNERHYIFTIRLYQEISKGNVGAAQAETNLMSLADLIIESFDTDLKLGNHDVYTMPPPVVTGWIQNQPIRTFEIAVDCVDINLT